MVGRHTQQQMRVGQARVKIHQQNPFPTARPVHGDIGGDNALARTPFSTGDANDTRCHAAVLNLGRRIRATEGAETLELKTAEHDQGTPSS